jgi:hypothetical protein
MFQAVYFSIIPNGYVVTFRCIMQQPLQSLKLTSTANLSNVTKSKKLRVFRSGERLGQDTGPCLPNLSPSAGSLKAISGGATEVGWGATMHEPHVPSNIRRQDSIQQV